MTDSIETPGEKGNHLPEWVDELSTVAYSRSDGTPHPTERDQLLFGDPDPKWWCEKLCPWLGPAEIRAAFSNPALRGLYIAPSEGRDETIKTIMRWCGWNWENYYFAQFDLRDKTRHAPYVEDFPEFYNYFIIREFGNKAVVGTLGPDGQLTHRSFDSFRDAYSGTFIMGLDAKGNPKRLKAAQAWLEHPLTKRFDRVDFKPGLAVPEHVFNLWRGWAVDDRPSKRFGPDGWVADPVDTEPPSAARLFRAHMLDNMCGGDLDLLFFLEGWLADALLYPWRNCEIAVGLRGPEGSGKSLWAACVAELFAPYTAILTQSKQLTGNFNSHLRDKVLVIADEAFFAGNPQEANTLKSLITSDRILVEPKGVDAFMLPKSWRLIMTSNEKWMIEASGEARRYFVLKVDAGDGNRDADYFGAIVDEWKSGGRAAYFRWLRSDYWREIIEEGLWKPQDKPETAELTAQRVESFKGPELVLANILRTGDVPCDHLIDDLSGRMFVPTMLLAEKARLKERDVTALGLLLASLTDEAPTRAYVAGQQRRGYWLPDLGECRRRFGRGVLWPSEAATWDPAEGPVYDYKSDAGGGFEFADKTPF